MSPLSATATSVGPLKVSGPSPSTLRAERQQHLAVGAELEDLVALAVQAELVGRPDEAFGVDVKAVGPHEHPLAEALHQIAVRIETQDGRLGTMEGPDMPPVWVGVHRDDLSPFHARGELRPPLDQLVTVVGEYPAF